MKKMMIAALWLVPLAAIADDEQLTGTVIGTELSVDYAHTQDPTTTVNTRAMAFDGDFETFFASWERSYTWVGLDLGRPCVITKVGWAPRNQTGLGEYRVVLAVFEGANEADFRDAVPLYIIREPATIGQMTYADISCSKGFRYVRYVGPSDVRCNVAELAFYGHEGEGDDSHLATLTNLPTVSIETEGGQLPYDKEHQIVTQLTVVSAEDGLISEPGTIRERGNASRGFPKRPYRIKFDKKQRPLNAPAKAKKWTLINNYGDKTLMRNLVAYEFSRLLGMAYTPYARSVDVVVNGEYKGCYQLSDQVQVHKNRVDIDEMTPQDVSGSNLQGGYLLEVDGYARDEKQWFTSQGGAWVTIKSPDEDSITTEQRAYIERRFNLMEGSFRNYLDMRSFLCHYLVQELSTNMDAYWSAFVYKKRDDPRLFFGPVWDFDIAFDNDVRNYPAMNQSGWLHTYCTYAGNFHPFVDKVMNSNEAQEQLLDLWDETRHNGLTPEHMEQFIDSLAAELDASQQLNFKRWPTLDQKVHNNPVARGSYKAEVDYLRQFVSDRIRWIDQKLGYVYVPRDESSIDMARIDYSQPYDVYTTDGRHCGTSLQHLTRGLYILRQGRASKKVAVR